MIKFQRHNGPEMKIQQYEMLATKIQRQESPLAKVHNFRKRNSPKKVHHPPKKIPSKGLRKPQMKVYQQNSSNESSQ
ncbi:34813_t:CDS:2 [Gigaspora margarita]|uniref:34813_t:CDS:1 n=1 Tax=Gigaspora margarita TaxID=4874 RepID=A0ABM8VZ78_GIGMA|nr:34813_t:CDS:2 [Gigaspora margarita]